MTENERLSEALEDFEMFCKGKSLCVTGEALEMIRTAIKEREQYRAIGTIDELKALKEKSVAKKVIVKKAENIELDVCDEKGNVHLCPNCNDYIVCSDMKHCWNCGQTLET